MDKKNLRKMRALTKFYSVLSQENQSLVSDMPKFEKWLHNFYLGAKLLQFFLNFSCFTDKVNMKPTKRTVRIK